jgi:hypothetical protein
MVILFLKGLKLFQVFFLKLLELLLFEQKNNLIQTISIKSGLVYEGKKFKNTAKKFIIQVKLFFQIFQLKNYHFVNI